MVRLGDMLMNRCSHCLNSRAIISENGIHYSCCLSSKKAIECVLGKKSLYIDKRELLEDALDIREGE